MAHRIQRMQNMVDKVDGNDKKEIKAAKKEIRKGKKSTGASVRAQVQDEFGRDHGYHSDASKKLNASKLVQRKYAQERRQTDRSQPSAQKGAAKDWEGESKFGTFGDASETFTRKEGRQINRATNKENKKESRERTKGSKARAKVIRKSYRNK
tara:strand:- start:961 stop:1419 length:459 start_codon:yes stop_codon:yes gene_type:complete